MSLRMLLKTLESGTVANIANFLLTLLHTLVEKFDDVDKRQDTEITAVNEQVHLLEDRTNAKLADMRTYLLEVIATHNTTTERCVDILAGRLDGLTAKALGPDTRSKN